jgi:hypothetical protein
MATPMVSFVQISWDSGLPERRVAATLGPEVLLYEQIGQIEVGPR